MSNVGKKRRFLRPAAQIAGSGTFEAAPVMRSGRGSKRAQVAGDLIDQGPAKASSKWTLPPVIALTRRCVANRFATHLKCYGRVVFLVTSLPAGRVTRSLLLALPLCPRLVTKSLIQPTGLRTFFAGCC